MTKSFSIHMAVCHSTSPEITTSDKGTHSNAKSSRIDMDNLKEIMRRNKAEISAELKNHGVQPDQIIECRRMFHESEQGVRTFSEAIATIHFNKFKSPLVTDYNFTELIDCFERQRKHHQMEADRRNGSMCYGNLPPQHIEVIQKVDKRFDDSYSIYYELSKYMFLIKFGWANIFH
ncbi:hypothetical protein MS3_00011078 [Schistosoma haematobium]|uniref:Uncharacterized protein n=1 Tax=Schistosoma haematobium TaxID=6185 RepID=A0A922IL06_SCHHA|nr:hypothetical protein MS3_00011078 [Schistosoma haematobium]KAH9581805.1 hypothetical protein MS3_00011078 [Schistosoma haematobium]